MSLCTGSLLAIIFKASVLGRPGKYYEKGIKSFKDIFSRGIPCVDRKNINYWAHVGNVYKDWEGLQGTNSAFISATSSSSNAETLLQESDLDEAYIIEFKPRGLNILDGNKTFEGRLPIAGHFAFIEDEKSVIGYVDARDIMGISIYRKGKFIKRENNPNFIKG